MRRLLVLGCVLLALHTGRVFGAEKTQAGEGKKKELGGVGEIAQTIKKGIHNIAHPGKGRGEVHLASGDAEDDDGPRKGKASGGRGALPENVGLPPTPTYISFLVAGALMGLAGEKFRLPSMSAVILIYAYRQVASFVDWTSSKLADSENETAKKFAGFINESSTHRLILVVCTALVLSIILISAVTFFLKAGIFVLTIALFSVGPGLTLLKSVGIHNNMYQVVIGIVAGVVLAMFVSKAIEVILFRGGFSLVGVSLAMVGADGLFHMNWILPKQILAMSGFDGPAPPGEIFILGIGAISCFFIQMLT